MWWFVAALVLVSVYSYSQTPKTQTTPPAGLNEIKAPIAEEGAEIPVLFGTRDLEGPNVVWFGHLRTVAVKKKGGKK